MGDRVEVDGSRGEGGGQILRTSLALSMITGAPLRMRNIRANRAKPGLRRQHVTCVKAAARLCDAHVVGDDVGSAELTFTPGAMTGPRVIEIDIGSPGATALVMQTVMVPAIVAGGGVRVVVKGGTHNPMAPPFEFLDRVFLPHLRAMGAVVTLTLQQYGFAPGDARGGGYGQITLEVAAGGPLRPIERVEAGAVVTQRASAILSRLPTHVGERELGVVRERLGWSAGDCEVREIAGNGTANVLLLEVERTGGREIVTAHGERGLRAEAVAARACEEVATFLAANVPVGAHLADQLLLPLAVARGGRFRTQPLSLHATTNVETIQQFLDVRFRIDAATDGSVVVSVEG